MSELDPSVVAGRIKKRYQFDKLDAVVVLGAVFQFDRKTGTWQSPTFINHYPAIHVAGELRAAAAGVLRHVMPESINKFLVTGGSDKHPDYPEIVVSRSENLRSLMRDVYGVPEKKMIQIGHVQSSHTRGNAQDTATFIEQNEEQFPQRQIGILSPRFQAARAKDFFAAESFFTKNGISFHWLMAERIMEEIDASFREKYSNVVYGSEVAVFCARKEQEGRAAFKSYNPGQRDEEYERLKKCDYSRQNAELDSVIRGSFRKLSGL